MLSLFSALLGSAANEFNRVAVTPKQPPQCARKKVRDRMDLDHALKTSFSLNLIFKHSSDFAISSLIFLHECKTKNTRVLEGLRKCV